MKAPAGLVNISYKHEKGKVKSVKLINVPSHLTATWLTVGCSGFGELVIVVAYGGNFYALVDVHKIFRGLENYTADKLITWSREIRKRINEKYSFVHTENETINVCSHILWAGAELDKTTTARNTIFHGDKAIVRSQC